MEALNIPNPFVGQAFKSLRLWSSQNAPLMINNDIFLHAESHPCQLSY